MKIQYVIAIHFMRGLINSYDFRFKGTATAGIGIHPTKTWLSQLVNFKNAIWTWGHFRRTIYNNYVMLQTSFGPSCMNQASVFGRHKRFKEVRESVWDDERCGRSKEANTLELIGHLRFFRDNDRRMSIETISAQFDVRVGTVHTIIREELKNLEIRKKDVVMTAGTWSSWSILTPQFLMLSWPAMKDGSTAMTERPRDKVPSGSMLAFSDPRRTDRANPPTNFWCPFFLTTLAWSTCTGFQLDRHSTRNTMSRF